MLQQGWRAYERQFGDLQPAWQGSILEDKRDAVGTMYRRNRQFDPATGRFTQEDPIGLAGGSNSYGFADGDPVNYSDPFGLCPPQDNDASTCPGKLGALVMVGQMVPAMNKAVVGFGALNVLPAVTVIGVDAAGASAAEVTIPVIRRGAEGAVDALEPTEGMIQQFTKQLAENGRASVERSIRTLSRRLAEHADKLEQINSSGGYTSSVEREISTFQRQLKAAQKVLEGLR